jgi:hypothetical protein
MRIFLNPAVQMPDQSAPLPRSVDRGERLGSNLIDIISARWLTPDNLPGALDRVGVVDSFASMADPEHGGFAW